MKSGATASRRVRNAVSPCSSVVPATPIEIRVIAAVRQHQYVRVWAAGAVCGCGLWRRAVKESFWLGLRLRDADGELKRSTLAHDERLGVIANDFSNEDGISVNLFHFAGI